MYFQNHIVDSSVIYLDIDIFFGGCFKELNSQLIGQLTASFIGNHTLILHVAFVAHQYDLCIVPGVGFDLSDPVEN